MWTAAGHERGSERIRACARSQYPERGRGVRQRRCGRCQWSAGADPNPRTRFPAGVCQRAPEPGVVLEAAGAHYCIVKPALAQEHLPAPVPLVGKAQDNRKEDRERAPRAEANRQARQPHYLLDAGGLGRRDNVFNALEVDVGRVCLLVNK